MDDMETTNALPPLSPTPVPLCVMDINMGTDQLKHTKKCNTIYWQIYVAEIHSKPQVRA